MPACFCAALKAIIASGCNVTLWKVTRGGLSLHGSAGITIASEHGLPVVPRGSGTGLAGAATPIGDALVIVTSKMNRILDVRPQDRLAWVEPGVINLDLGNALAGRGFTFAPDPSSQQTSTIGGDVSTNARGPHCLADGGASAHILALHVVLGGGGGGRGRSPGGRAARLRLP